MKANHGQRLLFAVGHYLADGLTGAATAAALSPLRSFFHLLVPGSLIGMFGGPQAAEDGDRQQGGTASG